MSCGIQTVRVLVLLLLIHEQEAGTDCLIMSAEASAKSSVSDLLGKRVERAFEEDDSDSSKSESQATEAAKSKKKQKTSEFLKNTDGESYIEVGFSLHV